jgi:hypothetical protein
MSNVTPSPLSGSDDEDVRFSRQLEALVLLFRRIKAEVSREDIEALQRRAIQGGDSQLADLCRDALDGDLMSSNVCGVLILEQRGSLI